MQLLAALKHKYSLSQIYSQQVSALSSVGGSSVTETTRRVLRKLMTTPVALQLNWMGKRRKIGLSTMEMKNVIFG